MVASRRYKYRHCPRPRCGHMPPRSGCGKSFRRRQIQYVLRSQWDRSYRQYIFDWMHGDRESWDVIVIGAGAAGLMAAIHAAERGRRTLVLEKNKKPGVKILMSGGTRCNITQATD